MTSSQKVSEKTIFVSNLPHGIGDTELEECFADIGPLKRCFVVKEKGTGSSRGFGYVTFSLSEDAEKAIKTIHKIRGQKIYLKHSDLKKDGKKTRKKENEEVPIETLRRETWKKRKENKNFIIKVTGFPHKMTRDDVMKHLKHVNEKEEVDGIDFVPGFMPKVSVRMHDGQAVIKTVAEIKKIGFSGNMLKTRIVKREENKTDDANKDKTNDQKDVEKKDAESVEDRLKPPIVEASNISTKKNKRPPRLIIRNLSFKASDKDIADQFRKYGKIVEIKILEKAGRRIGCAFIEFSSMPEANKALFSMNGKSISGRKVAIDWAVSKNDYSKMKNAEDSDSSSISGQSDDEEKTESPNKKKTKVHSSDQSDDDDDDDVSDSDEDEIDDSDEDASDDDGTDIENEDLSDELSESGNDEDSGIEDKKHIAKNDIAKNVRKVSNDVNQGKTLFIRNLSYDSQEDDLEEAFSEYGDLEYCRIVIDPMTDHSRGTAFIKFKTKEDADKCLKTSEDSPLGIVLDRRRLNITVAIDRNKAKEIQERPAEEKKGTDKRNLHLAREGLIRPGTLAAKDLTKADLEKRMKVEATKRNKLKNSNIFVSTTRLCIRNIPLKVTDSDLKKKLLKALEEKDARIIESRIMRDLTQVNSKGTAKSRGYGFVTFTEHDHALKALRIGNNNPDIFGENKRLIVEFSLENKAALEAKERRIERSKVKQDTYKKRSGEGDEKSKKDCGRRKNDRALISHLNKGSTQISRGKKASKALPTHSGPKVRHKKRQGDQSKHLKKTKKPMQQPMKRDEKRQRGGKRKGPSADGFDKLVESYKNKILGGPVSKRSKWYS